MSAAGTLKAVPHPEVFLPPILLNFYRFSFILNLLRNILLSDDENILLSIRQLKVLFFNSLKPYETEILTIIKARYPTTQLLPLRLLVVEWASDTFVFPLRVRQKHAKVPVSKKAFDFSVRKVVGGLAFL